MISSIVPDFNSHNAFKMRSSARVGGAGFLRLVMKLSLKRLSYGMAERLSTRSCNYLFDPLQGLGRPCLRRRPWRNRNGRHQNPAVTAVHVPMSDSPTKNQL